MRNTGLLVIYLKVVILRQVSQWNGWVCPDATTNKHTISEVFHEAYLLLNFSERVEQLMASWQFSLFLRPPTARRGLNPTTDEWEKNIPWSDVSGFLLLLGTAQFDFHNMKAWIISALYHHTGRLDGFQWKGWAINGFRAVSLFERPNGLVLTPELDTWPHCATETAMQWLTSLNVGPLQRGCVWWERGR